MVMPTNELAPTGRLRTVQQTMDFAGTGVTGNIDMFTIAGGAIYLEMFTGYVSQAITATGAVNIFLEFLPENLVAGLIALNTVLVITTDPVSTIYTMTGTVANPLAEEDNGLCLLPSFIANNWILGPGVINLDLVDVGAVGDVDGIIKWTIVYQPLNPLVTVVAE